MVFAGVSALSLILLGMAVFRPGGILDVLRLTEQVGTMRHEMGTLKTNNRVLGLEIRGLQKNPQEVERIAREVLGLVRPGEKVYEFIEGE
jgi:cell division protein FtsB